MAEIKDLIRDIPDFPKQGIMFRDITPLLADPAGLRAVVSEMASRWQGKIDIVAGLDARGFIFGTALAYEMMLPFVPVRKKGKLPGETVEVEYALEYGSSIIQMQKGACPADSRVLVVDDLLATGGTAAAACRLVREIGAQVAGCAFVIELAELNGRDKLPDGVHVQSLAVYGEPLSKAA